MKRSQRVYLEAYTSLLLVPKEKLVGGRVHCRCSHSHTAVHNGATSCCMSQRYAAAPQPTALHMLLLLPAGGVLWQGGDCGGSRDGGNGELAVAPSAQTSWRDTSMSAAVVLPLAKREHLDTSLQILLTYNLLLDQLQEADSILEGAEEGDVSFLVVGDPFG